MKIFLNDNKKITLLINMGDKRLFFVFVIIIRIVDAEFHL